MSSERLEPPTDLNCPDCTRPLSALVFGLVKADGRATLRAKYGPDVMFGGCVVPSPEPSHYCRACGHALHWDGQTLTPTAPVEIVDWDAVERRARQINEERQRRQVERRSGRQ